jgi:hypothetical protein
VFKEAGLTPALYRNRKVGKLAVPLIPSRKMIAETESSFVRRIIVNPPSQRVEEAASKSLETRRIPDTYIYLLLNGRLYTPSGVAVEDKIG